MSDKLKVQQELIEIVVGLVAANDNVLNNYEYLHDVYCGDYIVDAVIDHISMWESPSHCEWFVPGTVRCSREETNEFYGY